MKKIVAILMILFLLVGGLAACGETEAPEPEELPTVEETPEAEAPEEEAEPEEEEPEEEEEAEAERHEPDEAILEELVGRTHDFRSVLDTETGAVLFLGDPKSTFEGMFGEAGAFADEGFLLTFADTEEIVSFGNSGLVVGFQDGAATLILAVADRFELKDVTIDMAASELSETFSPLELDEGITMNMRGITLQGEPALLPVALHEHLQSDENFVIHQAYVSDDHVTAFAVMIHRT